MAEYVEQIRYTADISDVRSKLERLERKNSDAATSTGRQTGRMREAWKSVTGSIGKTVASIGKVTAGLAAAGIGVAAVWGPKILEQGAALEVIGKKAETIFGGSNNTMVRWAEENAAALGVTSTQLLGLAANTADLLKPMGFASDEAARMAAQTNELAGTLSAWTGGTIAAEEASMILTKAYLGERDALTSLGIKISEADVQARLAAKGQKDLTGEALQMAKAVATQELIFESTADAQKAWNDGTLDSVKAMNRSKASTAELKESLVRNLYPVVQAAVPIVTRLTEAIGQHLPGAIAIARQWFAANWPQISATIQTFVEWFQTNAWPVIQSIFSGIVEVAGRVITWIRENWPTFQEVIGTVVAFLVDDVWPVVERIFGFIQTAVEDVVAKVRQEWPSIQETIEGVMEAIQVIIEKVIATITFIWENWGEEISALVETVFGAIKVIIESTLKIIQGIIDTVTGLITGDWDRAWNGILTIIRNVWDLIVLAVQAPLTIIRLAISAAWTGLKGIVSFLWGKIVDAISEKWTEIKDLIGAGVEAVIGFVADLPGEIVSKVTGAFDVIVDEFKEVLNKLIRFWNDLSFTLPSFDGIKIKGKTIIPGFTGPTIHTPNIPELARGGVLTEPRLVIAGEYTGARTNPEIVTPQKTMEASFAKVLAQHGGGLGTGPITLVIEGRPFTAMLAEHDERTAANLRAGSRAA